MDTRKKREETSLSRRFPVEGRTEIAWKWVKMWGKGSILFKEFWAELSMLIELHVIRIKLAVNERLQVE